MYQYLPINAGLPDTSLPRDCPHLSCPVLASVEARVSHCGIFIFIYIRLAISFRVASKVEGHGHGAGEGGPSTRITRGSNARGLAIRATPSPKLHSSHTRTSTSIAPWRNQHQYKK